MEQGSPNRHITRRSTSLSFSRASLSARRRVIFVWRLAIKYVPIPWRCVCQCSASELWQLPTMQPFIAYLHTVNIHTWFCSKSTLNLMLIILLISRAYLWVRDSINNNGSAILSVAPLPHRKQTRRSHWSSAQTLKTRYVSGHRVRLFTDIKTNNST